MKIDRLFGAVAALAVAGTVALAFMVVGSPAHQRELAIDRQRTVQLSYLAARLGRRYGAPGESLPRSLPLELGQPESMTLQPPEYQRVSATRYVLCATFDLASEPRETDDMLGQDGWRHAAGRACFHLDTSHAPPYVHYSS